MREISAVVTGYKQERWLGLVMLANFLVASAINLFFWLPDVASNLTQVTGHPSVHPGAVAIGFACALIIGIVLLCMAGHEAYSTDSGEDPFMGMQWLLCAFAGSGFIAWMISFLVVIGWASVLDAAHALSTL